MDEPKNDLLVDERKDVFLCHASEDKDFVREVGHTLQRLGVSFWLDESEIQIGDSIRQKINEGLRGCRYGVVFLSDHFFSKRWPQAELAALTTLVQDGKVVLPVWKDVDEATVRANDPLLADVKAANARDGYREVAQAIANRVNSWSTGSSVTQVYVGRTMRVLDLQRDTGDIIRNVVFRGCTLQGPVVLFPHRGVRFSQMGFNSEWVFWVVEPGRPYVGALGLENVTFAGCKFKDVGIAVNPSEFTEIINHLR